MKLLKSQPWKFRVKTSMTLLLTSWAVLGSSAARADVKVYSAMPGGVKLRYPGRDGQMKELNLAPLQQTTLQCADKQPLALVVQDPKGGELVNGTMGDRSHWIISPGKDGKAALIAAGGDEGGRPLAHAIQIFNATGYNLLVQLSPISGNPGPDDELTLPRNQACAPYETLPGTCRLIVKDEGGNPLGQTFSYVRPGHFYVIFRKGGTTCDVEPVGSIVSAP